MCHARSRGDSRLRCRYLRSTIRKYVVQPPRACRPAVDLACRFFRRGAHENQNEETKKGKEMTRFIRPRRRALLLAGAFALAALLAGLPAGDPAHAQQKDPIRIGLSMALTGVLAGPGKTAMIGLQAWAEDANAD